MATATKNRPPASSVRVFGGGRHRVYFEPGNTRLDDPVMNPVGKECARGLPEKNRETSGDQADTTPSHEKDRP